MPRKLRPGDNSPEVLATARVKVWRQIDLWNLRTKRTRKWRECLDAAAQLPSRDVVPLIYELADLDARIAELTEAGRS